MTRPTFDADLCVLGAGPLAAALALAAVRLGAATALVAPAGRAAESERLALAALGQAARTPALWPVLRDQLAAAVAGDPPARLAALGVRLVAGPGRFAAPDRIEADGGLVRFRRAVIVPPACGASVFDTVLAWEALPARLCLCGDGAEAAALAQALARLGVTVFWEGGLTGFDPELAAFVLRRLTAEGVAFHAPRGDLPRLALPAPGPDLGDLGLAEAEVAWDQGRGILCRPDGRTSNRRIWAAPCAAAGSPNAVAVRILRGALLRLPGSRPVTLVACPTDPALAQVGLDEAGARAARRQFRLLRWPTEDGGLIKAVVDVRGRVLGAGIAARDAATLIAPWSLAVARRLPASALAAAPVPFPSSAEAGRLAAASAAMPLLLSGRLARWMRLMLRLG